MAAVTRRLASAGSSKRLRTVSLPPAAAIGEVVLRLSLQAFQPLDEAECDLVLQLGVGEVGERPAPARRTARSTARAARAGSLALLRSSCFSHSACAPRYPRGLVAPAPGARLRPPRAPRRASARAGAPAPPASPRRRALRSPPPALSLGLAQRSFDAFLAPLHGARDRAVEEALQQPDQNQEVDDLGGDREPVDLHAAHPPACAITCVPEGVGEDQDHRDHEAVDRGRLDHRQADEQRARDGVAPRPAAGRSPRAPGPRRAPRRAPGRSSRWRWSARR